MQNIVEESLNLASSGVKTNIGGECEQRSCVYMYKCFNAARMWLEWLAICRT